MSPKPTRYRFAAVPTGPWAAATPSIPKGPRSAMHTVMIASMAASTITMTETRVRTMAARDTGNANV